MSLLTVDVRELAGLPVVRVWRHPNYARFMGGLGPYYISSWMQRVAVGWMAWELSHSNAWVGAIAAADLGPMILLAPLAGAIADRSNPLFQIRVMLLGLMLQAVVLATFAIAGLMDVWLLFCLSLVSGVLQPFYNSARQTVIPLLVPRVDFASAVSLDSSFFQGSRFLGPAIAAVSIPVVGSGGTCALHVVGCLLFVTMCGRIDVEPPDRSRSHTRSLAADILEGFIYIRRHAAFWPLFLMMLAASIVARPLQDLLPGFAGGIFHSGPLGLAWLTSSMGVGAMAAAVFIASREGAPLSTLAILSTCGLALSIFGFVATNHLLLAVAFALLFGFTFTLMGVAIQVQAQVAVVDSLRGRVMSLFTLIYRGMPAIGAVLLGNLAEHVGLRSAFVFSAVVCLLIWLALAPRTESIKQALHGVRE